MVRRIFTEALETKLETRPGITREKLLEGALDEQLGCTAADLGVTDDGGVHAEGPPRRPTGSAARPRA